SLVELWGRFLREAAEDGELRPGVDTEKAAAIIQAAAIGMIQLWTVKPEDHEISAMEEALLHLVDCLSLEGPQVPRAGGRRPRGARSGTGTGESRPSSRQRTTPTK